MKTYWKVNIQLLNMENQKVIDEYLLELKNTNKRDKTIKNYRYILQNFFKDRKESYLSITNESINQFFKEHQDKLMESTQRVYLKVLSSFFYFCVKERNLEKSPITLDMIGRKNERYWEPKTLISNHENEKVLNSFLLSLKRANRSKGTIIHIRKIMQSFLKRRVEVISSLTSEDIKDYLELHHNNCTNKTIQIYISYIRSFLNYCVEQGYMEKAPFIQINSEGIQTKREGNQKKYWAINISLSNSKNEEVLNEYLLSLKVLNYSEDTIKTRRNFLQSFFKETELYSALVSSEILQMLNKVTEGKKEKTISNYIGYLKCFYDFCVEEGYMEKSPIKSRWFPRIPKPVPKYLDKEEIAKVHQRVEKENIRTRALFEFLLTSGCRIGEVHKIDREDIDLETRTALVSGKGRKFRQVHFSVKCAILLERYLDCRKDNESALFVTMNGAHNRLATDTMRKLIGNMGKEAGLRGSLHPHRLRHTFATDLLAKGAELSFIADELGHSNLMTTQVYARLPKRAIITMYRKYMG